MRRLPAGLEAVGDVQPRAHGSLRDRQPGQHPAGRVRGRLARGRRRHVRRAHLREGRRAPPPHVGTVPRGGAVPGRHPPLPGQAQLRQHRDVGPVGRGRRRRPASRSGASWTAGSGRRATRWWTVSLSADGTTITLRQRRFLFGDGLREDGTPVPEARWGRPRARSARWPPATRPPPRAGGQDPPRRRRGVGAVARSHGRRGRQQRRARLLPRGLRRRRSGAAWPAWRSASCRPSSATASSTTPGPRWWPDPPMPMRSASWWPTSPRSPTSRSGARSPRSGVVRPLARRRAARAVPGLRARASSDPAWPPSAGRPSRTRTTSSASCRGLLIRTMAVMGNDVPTQERGGDPRRPPAGRGGRRPARGGCRRHGRCCDGRRGAKKTAAST